MSYGMSYYTTEIPEHGGYVQETILRQGCANENAALIKNAAITALVCLVLAGIALYVLYAGDAGPTQLWNLSSHTLHQTAAIIAGTGGGLAAIVMISALCRRALNDRNADNVINGFYSRPYIVSKPGITNLVSKPGITSLGESDGPESFD